MNGKKIAYNMMALITVMIWGTTFVSTKILISNGLNPVVIFIIRFVIAYICALFISHNRLWASNLNDELLLLSTGITGGSLYFISENTALSMTYASNVSLVICCAPIITMILGKILFRDIIKPIAWIGSLIAFIGVTIVIYNSSALYGINPTGDLLTFVAALSWSVYCLILKTLNIRYDNLFITRKVFAYGAATAIIYYFLTADRNRIEITETVIGNLIFLSIGASFLCYLMWNLAIKKLGAEKTSNYIYLVPLVTILASAFTLEEPLTIAIIAGTCLILGGVFMSSMKS